MRGLGLRLVGLRAPVIRVGMVASVSIVVVTVPGIRRRLVHIDGPVGRVADRAGSRSRAVMGADVAWRLIVHSLVRNASRRIVRVMAGPVGWIRLIAGPVIVVGMSAACRGCRYNRKANQEQRSDTHFRSSNRPGGAAIPSRRAYPGKPPPHNRIILHHIRDNIKSTRSAGRASCGGIFRLLLSLTC